MLHTLRPITTPYTFTYYYWQQLYCCFYAQEEMHMLKRKQKLPHSLLHCWKLISIETEMEIIKQFIRGRYGRCMLGCGGSARALQ